MVLRSTAIVPLMGSLVTLLLSTGFVLTSGTPTARAQSAAGSTSTPRPGEVTLPLKDYLALVESAEAAEKARAARIARAAVPLSEVVSQRTLALVQNVEKGDVEVTSEFEVLVQGRPTKPVALPLVGYPGTVEILRDGKPLTGATAGAGGGPALAALFGPGRGVVLVAPEEGRYAVKIVGRASLLDAGGIGRLVFPPPAAPVAVLELDLPADAAWSSPGGIVDAESEQGGRRRVRLASPRGAAQTLELKRRFDSTEAEKLLAQTVVLTLFQLRPEGVRRHDVVLYEVSRGALASFAVDLPPGVEVEQAATDEGLVVPIVEGGRLTVHRRRQLQGTGYLVLTSTPPANLLTAGTALVPALPGLDVRARYLAVASSIAAESRPVPETAWARVDLDDLPPSFREALQVVDLVAAWRATQPAARASGEGPERLEIAALQAAATQEPPVLRRETTTLLTVDGALVHRDRFTLSPSQRPGAALDMTLPAGATLWSARIGDQPVRPLDRNGKISVPLGFGAGGGTSNLVIEVVSVQEQAVPRGRSDLALELPQLTRPVLDHRWRLLLPEGPKYRFKSGDLRPAREELYAEPAVALLVEDAIEETITVTGETRDEFAARKSRARESRPAPPPEALQSQISTGVAMTGKDLDELKQALQGGVKPLPISIPESGKVLLLTGLLPPPRVAVELEVRGKR